jgi:guanylate kinase
MSDRLDIFELMRAPSPGTLFVFAGPSGAGKSSVCRGLLAGVPGVEFSVSHTTREPRPDEAEGRDYHFVSDDEFGRIVEAGGFAEHAGVFGHRYGTSREQLGLKLERGDVLLDIDVQGAAQLRESHPEAVSVFVVPPSLEELRARLIARNQNAPDDVKRRLAQAETEMKEAVHFDYALVNDELDRAVAAAAAIITAERHRMARRLGPR